MSLLGSGAVFAANGQQLYAACAACHGQRAEGNAALGAPALAGQSTTYVQRQLRNFRAGMRGVHAKDSYGAQMRAASQATLRDDAAITAVATYVASLPRVAVKPAPKFDARNGNNLYQGKCSACHGGMGEGNEALAAPRLAGLDAAYLKRQYRNFGAGVRGAHAQDKTGRQMALMATMLPNDRDLDDVIGYVHMAGAAAR
jgi:cytochrome c oxidase subunit 2